MRTRVSQIWTRRRAYAPYLLLVGTVIALFARTLSYSFFVFDDATHLNNPHLNPLNWKTPIWIWGYSLMPVPYTFWAVIAALFGTKSPVPFRALNIVLHATNACLVFVWLRRILPLVTEAVLDAKSVLIASLIGAFVFAVHPVQVETVVWISSAKQLLCFTFGLLSFLSYLDSRTQKNATSAAFAYVFLLLSCFSQIGGASLLAVYFWLDVALFKRVKFALLKEYGSIALLGCIALWIYYKLMPTQKIGYVPSLPWRLVFSSHMISFYVSKLLFWFDYHFDYGMDPISITKAFMENPTGNELLAGVSACVLLLIALMYFYRSTRPFHYSAAILLLLLTPFLGIFPFVHQNISTAADRYLYLPSIGVSLISAVLIASFPKKRLWTGLSAAGFALFLITKTALLIPNWKTSVTYLSYSVGRNPLSMAGRVGLTRALAGEGRLNEAIQEFDRAARLGLLENFQPVPNESN